MSSHPKKLILVIGATGAQGLAVIDALLSPSESNTPSPYAVRALTRDVSGKRAKELAARGVELIEGRSDDPSAVARALGGAYGAFVNTNGSGIGEMAEIYTGIRIFEIAKRMPTLRHYIWSNLRHVSKNAGFDPDYRAEHMDGKGRVGEWLQAQESSATEDGLAWSTVTTGPYMDMLKGGMFRPLNIREDGTVVFAAPVGDGKVPLIALKDLGWWARYSFDHRKQVSGKELNVTSERVSWDHLVKSPAAPRYTNASHLRTGSLFSTPRRSRSPLANELRPGANTTTLGQNLSCFWRVLRDDIIDKDMAWITRTHPGTYTLERWMREEGYTGSEETVLKSGEDGKFNWKTDKAKTALL
ncbi:NmrA domain-containing protein [Mycena kentingensis (nom. inval.)]|nr:NmrA domain-containing protein [Mycena kentingensis (nom. inval.)]